MKNNYLLIVGFALLTACTSESQRNFELGTLNFKNERYIEAVPYFVKIDDNDPNYQEAQRYLDKIDSIRIIEKNKQKGISEPIDYSEFDYRLPGSNFTYKVKIIGIETKTIKDAFNKKSPEYAAPEKIDGYLLTLRFSITNPYDQEMMAPVPDYHYLTSSNKEWFASSTIERRDCSCRITNYSEVFTTDGKMVFLSAEGKCGYDDWCIRFAANETKEFDIQFKEPIFGEVKKVVFSGFGLMGSIPDGRRERDKGLIIDIDNKEVIGERSFY